MSDDTIAFDKSPAAQLGGWVDPVTGTDLIARRREIHRTPETGWTEFIATARAAEALTALGFKVLVGREFINPQYVRGRDDEEVRLAELHARAAGVSPSIMQRMGGITGLAAVLDTGRPGRTIAFRAELDAIKLQEPEDMAHIPYRLGFASDRPGAMHACGHDGHQAAVLELARFVAANRDRLSGRIKLIFQPGEEGSRGAYPIVQSGQLDDVDVLVCAHLMPDLEGGTIVSAPEKFLCTTKIDFRFEGEASHAGMQPQLGRNALLAAADASLLLMALPRHGEGMTRVNVGTLHAGEGRNIVASHAAMQVEVRGENEAINRALTREAIQRAEGCAMAFGVRCEREIMGEAVDFVPDDGIVQMITVCARRSRYVKNVVHAVPYNGSDDATLMIRRVQSRGGKAGYFLVGAALDAEHEHAHVDFDEKYLITLYDMYSNLLIGLSGAW
jgi:aminobenzoyl-glutamate utilization protein A